MKPAVELKAKAHMKFMKVKNENGFEGTETKDVATLGSVPIYAL